MKCPKETERAPRARGRVRGAVWDHAAAEVVAEAVVVAAAVDAAVAAVGVAAVAVAAAAAVVAPGHRESVNARSAASLLPIAPINRVPRRTARSADRPW